MRKGRVGVGQLPGSGAGGSPVYPGYLPSWGPLTLPLPAGRCWLDALELALRCSSLLRLSACKQGRDGEPGSSPDGSPSSLCGLPASGAIHDQDLVP